MLTALSVVVTRIRGPREQVQVIDEKTGVPIPPSAAVPLARALRRRMGGAGRARALALYDEGAVVARTLDLLGL